MRANLAISLLLLTGCISEQKYRTDSEALRQEVKATEAAYTAQMKAAEKAAEARVRVAAADAASEAQRRLEASHRDALTLHKQATVKATGELVDAKLLPIRKMVEMNATALRAHMEAVKRQDAIRLQDEERHDIRTEERLKGFSERLVALRAEFVGNLADDKNDRDLRMAALERLKAAEVKLDRAELDVNDLRHKLNASEAKTEDAKDKAKDADRQASTATWGAAGAVVLGLLNELRKWLASRKEKKA